MYVSGHGTRANSVYVSEADLESDVRFTELVAQFIGSVRQVRLLQDERSRLNSFFSPQVIDSLTTGSKSRSLEPAEREITVLFCDVRGFSKKAERFKDDLLGLLGSVRAALGIMVDGILEQDGTIADFQGDAALGFWGWPVELKYGPIPACRAALAIQKKFEEASRSSELMDTFSVGIGIAHGRAVAGQIGTDQQSKIGVFGPVVNQCARLESMTKQFGVSICVYGRTAEFIDRYLSESDARLRPLAKVRPRGMDVALDVFNLLPSESEFPEVTAQVIKDHSAAWEAVVDGRWSEAIEALDRVPDDGPKSFLIRQMAAFGNKAPDNWTGAFSLL